MEEPKEWYRSRVLWLNVSAFITAVGGYLTGEVDLTVAGPAAFLAFMNILLRFVTKQPIVV